MQLHANLQLDIHKTINIFFEMEHMIASHGLRCYKYIVDELFLVCEIR